MRLAGIISALAIVLALISPRTAHAEDDRARFSGASFRYAGTEEERAARRAAIDRGIDSLFFAIRGIARSRLSEGTKIDPWVAFSIDAQTIRVQAPSSDAMSPSSGALVQWGSASDGTKLSQRLEGGKITQMFLAGEGRRVNEWTLSPDASTLSLKVTVSSSKLSHPVVYTLTYTRAR